MLVEKDPNIDKAVQRLVYVSADEQLRYNMEMREKAELDYFNDIANSYDRGKNDGEVIGRETGFTEGRETGFTEGREAGLAEGRETIANMAAEIERLKELIDKQ